MSYQPITPRTTSTMAIVSLGFGIASWILLPFVGAIVAIVCGHAARREIRQAPPGYVDGDGMAIAGLVLGYVHLALALIGAVILTMVLVFGFGVGTSLLQGLH